MKYVKYITPLFVIVILFLCGLLAPSNGVDDMASAAPAERLNRVLILFALLAGIISTIKIVDFFKEPTS